MTEAKKSQDPNELNLTEAANHSHVCRQAIYKAIQCGRLPAYKKGQCWYMLLDDLEMYRATKYRRDLKIINGEPVFDIEKGHFSVVQVSKILAEMLKKPYSEQKIYYKLRLGKLKGKRVGGQWVIEREDAVALYEQEIGEDKNQMRFA